MGPSSVRRDILSKYREEKKALGITKGSRRSRRGARVTKDSKSRQSDDSMRPTLTRANAALPTTRFAAMSIQTQGFGGTPNHASDKENDHDSKYDHDADDDDEFFDAEDASLGGHTVTDDPDELDHGAVN
jgi:hypothetical protein